MDFVIIVNYRHLTMYVGADNHGSATWFFLKRGNDPILYPSKEAAMDWLSGSRVESDKMSSIITLEEFHVLRIMSS